MSRKVLVPALLVLAVSAVGFQVTQAARLDGTTMAGLIFGPSHTVKQQAFKGFYDGHEDTYYNTDVSTKAQSKALHVNFVPVLTAAYPKSTSPMYFVSGRAAKGQRAVFGSEPGDVDYSPLWQEIVVKWKSGVKPVLLTSDDQTNGLASKGKLTERQTKTILNAPITKVGK